MVKSGTVGVALSHSFTKALQSVECEVSEKTAVHRREFLPDAPVVIDSDSVRLATLVKQLKRYDLTLQEIRNFWSKTRKDCEALEIVADLSGLSEPDVYFLLDLHGELTESGTNIVSDWVDACRDREMAYDDDEVDVYADYLW